MQASKEERARQEWELARALDGVMRLIADKTLVRDISHDHEPGWSLKATRLVLALKRAGDALDPYRAELETGHANQS